MRKHIYFISLILPAFWMPATYAACDNFAAWKKNYTQSDNIQQLNTQEAKNTLANARYLKKVIQNDRNQPEFKRSFADYTDTMVSAERIQQGRKHYQNLQAELQRLEQQYGVAGEYLVAFWGVETHFGKYQGDIKTIDALATLSCDTRRSAFFTKELDIFLSLVDKGQLPAGATASWAGAMGHLQFMPNKIEKYRTDANGDGVVDIFKNRADAFETAANYLQQEGWQANVPWGHKVQLPEGFDQALEGRFKKQPLSFWHKLGLKSDDAYFNDSENQNILVAVVIPRDSNGEAFITYNPNDVFVIKVLIQMMFHDSIILKTNKGKEP